MKSNRPCHGFVVFLFLLTQSLFSSHALAASERIDYKAVDVYLNSQIQAHRIPGAALAVVQGGRVVHTQGYGEASPGRAMTPSTPMFIGSVSKSFTAVAVLQLVEQGRVSLDAPVQQYLPNFTLRDPQQASKITVRHLLNQTSGLAFASLPNDALPENASLRQAVDSLAKATLVAEPGSAFIYCNHNYTLLGLLVETVSGEPYGEYIQKHIFLPLGMQQSYISKAEAVEAGLAQGYNHFFGFPIPRSQPQPLAALPAGFLISTAADMGKYLAFQLGNVESSVLSSKSLELLHTPPAEINSNYAMGWHQNQRAGIPTIEHAGDVDTFHANAVLLPEQDTAFALLYNLNGILQVVTVYDAIQNGLIAIWNQQPPTGGVSLWLVYLFLTIFFVFDLGRKIISLARLPDWGRKALEKGKPKAVRGAVIGIMAAILILLGLPYLIFRQVGLTVLRALIIYHTDVALYVLLTSLLSLTLGISRLIWLQRLKVFKNREIL